MLHNVRRTSLIASILLATAASTAAAQTVAAPIGASPSPATAATAPAPITHDWNDVSHVNGQLVPVGQSNDYLKKFRRTNLSTNPVGWLIGFYGVSASYALTNHVGSSRVDLQACKLEYSIVSPK